MEGVEPSTVALLAQRSNQLSYTTSTGINNSDSIMFAFEILSIETLLFRVKKL